MCHQRFWSKREGGRRRRRRFSRSLLPLALAQSLLLLLLLPPKPPSRKSTTMVGPSLWPPYPLLIPTLGSGERWASPKKRKRSVFFVGPQEEKFLRLPVGSTFALLLRNLGRSGRQKREHGGRERDLITFGKRGREENPQFSRKRDKCFFEKKLLARGFPHNEFSTDALYIFSTSCRQDCLQ